MPTEKVMRKECETCEKDCLDKCIKEIADTLSILNSPKEWENSQTVSVPIEMPIKSAAYFKHIMTDSPLSPDDAAKVIRVILQRIFMLGLGFVVHREKVIIKED